MRIGLIDVDGHKFPNLALMKLSSWHKEQGDTVEWHSYDGWFDKVYMAKVFSEAYTEDVPEPFNATQVIRGVRLCYLDGGRERSLPQGKGSSAAGLYRAHIP